MNKEGSKDVQPDVQSVQESALNEVEKSVIARGEKGHFLPGHGSPNPAGRGKNVPTKTTQVMKQFAIAAINNNAADFNRELKKLKGIQKVNAILALLDYVLPRLQRIQHEGDSTDIKITQVFKIGDTEIKF